MTMIPPAKDELDRMHAENIISIKELYRMDLSELKGRIRDNHSEIEILSKYPDDTAKASVWFIFRLPYPYIYDEPSSYARQLCEELSDATADCIHNLTDIAIASGYKLHNRTFIRSV